ncbi:MAG TPA: GNAT family N-acetyltransferase [Candidatus Dormibacteraeota bacterium]|nr:GNAT family N-acetyltransferase [Candidatus Dormibacteraeota bacterium]
MDALGVVRRAEPDDATAIARVHVATWRTAYRGLLPDDFLASLDEAGYAERWRRTLADGADRVYVAENADRVIGFASGGRERAGEGGYSGELYAIYVLQEMQGHGHGRRLVQAVVGGLRELALRDMIVWVLRDNAPARRFYESLGGVYVRQQPITIGSAVLQEVSYGWRSLDDVRY